MTVLVKVWDEEEGAYVVPWLQFLATGEHEDLFDDYAPIFEQILGSIRAKAPCPSAASPTPIPPLETAIATPVPETATPVPTPETATATPAAETPTVAPTPETATPVATPTLADTVAVITEVRGDVSVSGSDKRGEDLKDQLLTEGQVITTGPDGYVEVAIVNNVELTVRPNTKLTLALEALKTPALDITIGELRAKVKKLEPRTDFRLRMPPAMGAVRGTDLVVKVTQDESRVTVLEGVMDVWTPDESQRVTVEENEEVVATAEGLGDPYPIDPDEIDRWWEAAFGEEGTDITDRWWLAVVAVGVVLVVVVAGWVIVRRRKLA